MSNVLTLPGRVPLFTPKYSQALIVLYNTLSSVKTSNVFSPQRSRSHQVNQVVHQVPLPPAPRPVPTSISDLGQRKSKKKRAASPVPSESSGEEYDPSRGDTAAAMSVAAPKPRQPKTRNRKPTAKSKGTYFLLLLFVLQNSA